MFLSLALVQTIALTFYKVHHASSGPRGDSRQSIASALECSEKVEQKFGDTWKQYLKNNN